MSKKSDCNIVKDLLPTYIDGLCSSESKEFIEDHLRNCPDCKEVFEMMQDDIKVEDLGPGKKEEELTIDQKKIINSVREKMQRDIRRKTNFYRVMCVAIILFVIVLTLPIKSIPSSALTVKTDSREVSYNKNDSKAFDDLTGDPIVLIAEGVQVDEADFYPFDGELDFDRDIYLDEKWIDENDHLTLVNIESTYPIKKYSYSIENVDGKNILKLNKAKTSMLSGQQQGVSRVSFVISGQIDGCEINN